MGIVRLKSENFCNTMFDSIDDVQAEILVPFGQRCELIIFITGY